ncbi:AraC family transcriptional regulator [Synechococcus sp. CS-1332]|uniref:AraC family transcriptional regulator n=1 Tax=Synechococcus sp. CS-1332 TaxID=2847972 RepID=UPI00223AAB08|nr:AraC family transcriptional regulator [Synechococcus sp. CS-1332]MCT0207461.1 AraC family transcriptional regulator [Synechococcus sp. CS-1332]
MADSRTIRTDNLAPILPSVPLLSSVGAGWQGITLEQFRCPPFETPEYSYPDHKIAIHTRIPEDLRVKRRLNGRVQVEQVIAEQVIVVPAGVTHQVQWDQSSEFLILTLKPDVLGQVAHEAIAPDQVDLVPDLPRVDSLLRQLGLALLSELEMNGGRDHLYVESLQNCLAVHLLKTYSAVPPRFPPAGPLPPSSLALVTGYIQDHLDQTLPLADLAALVGLSACYFASLFKQSTGTSPHQFIVQCRLQRSQHLLKRSDAAIADIAIQCGFSSQSHLTRLFRKHLGTTPKIYRLSVK